MKKFYYLILLCVIMLTGYQASSQIFISAMMPNPAGTDSADEYVQLIATENIDFATTPYSVVILNNGAVTAKGWANGTNISYKFNLTNGSVNTGDVFFVGGDRKLINGTGSTDISGLTWIRAIKTSTTAGDGLGNFNSTGVFGNGGANADGAGVFLGTTIDSTSIPIDALFFGSSIGTAYVAGPPEKGYQVPTNDHFDHAQGFFGAGTNTFFSSCTSLQDTLLSFTGTYDTTLNSWVIPRTTTKIKLSTTSLITDIQTNITLTGTVVGIDSKDVIDNNISIFPNPSNGVFTINNLPAQALVVEVFDILGNSVYSTHTSQKEIYINMESAGKGMYFVEITSPAGNKIVRKMIIK
ncbi:MAG TPA: T9SS type A sorting domain-containing protein [Bacteroidales bacterium]|nr:T9SS type A sorting domain-containing protein [Bacteroidales bacterium]